MKNILLVLAVVFTLNANASTMQDEDIMCLGLINWGWEVIGKTQLGYMDKTFDVIKGKYTQKEFNKNIRAIYSKKADFKASFAGGYLKVSQVQQMLAMCQQHAGVK